jgi:hypothetical protein
MPVAVMSALTWPVTSGKLGRLGAVEAVGTGIVLGKIRSDDLISGKCIASSHEQYKPEDSGSADTSMSSFLPAFSANLGLWAGIMMYHIPRRCDGIRMPSQYLPSSVPVYCPVRSPVAWIIYKRRSRWRSSSQTVPSCTGELETRLCRQNFHYIYHITTFSLSALRSITLIWLLAASLSLALLSRETTLFPTDELN